MPIEMVGTSDSGAKVEVLLEECGEFDMTITINGVKLRSLYDWENVYEEALEAVSRRYGNTNWLWVVTNPSIQDEQELT